MSTVNISKSGVASVQSLGRSIASGFDTSATTPSQVAASCQEAGTDSASKEVVVRTRDAAEVFTQEISGIGERISALSQELNALLDQVDTNDSNASAATGY